MKKWFILFLLLLTSCAPVLCNDGFPNGLSWTAGAANGVTTDPTGVTVAMPTSAGPFFNICVVIPLTSECVEFYLGARPTPPESSGVGNEGVLPSLSELMKTLGLGNYGMALRIEPTPVSQ